MITETPITGATLRAMGYHPGPWYPAAIAEAEAIRQAGGGDAQIRAAIDALQPPAPLALRTPGCPATFNIGFGENEAERSNVAAVTAHMLELMRTPTLKAGAVLPDACPSGSAPGTIPVGGVVAAETAIHPGFHSADICCSMALTAFSADASCSALLDAGMRLSHFGPGGRPRGAQWKPPAELLECFAANPFLADTISPAIEHFGTQGDGNHFFFVGRSAATGRICLVTHHGSRKPGALLYRRGMAAAEKVRRALAPEVPVHNAWIPADTRDGEAYWEALQLIREWTRASHYAIHDAVADALGLKATSRFWNEHNFVFRKSDGLFYHAKGATPAFPGFAADASPFTLIPLNMAAPVLVTQGRNAPNALGFAPHGAGRNFSRTAYLRSQGAKTPAEMVAEQTVGIDARFFCGIPDASELPGAYKDAARIRAEIERYGLADVVDTIEPFGSIMAGDWERDAPWRRKKALKQGEVKGPRDA